MNTHRASMVLFALCVAACSGGAGPRSSGPVPIDQLADEVAQTTCDELFACLVPSNDYLLLRAALGNTARCSTFLASQLARDDGLTQRIALVRLGRIRYDAARARACLEDARSQCVLLTGDRPVPSCSRVFEGTVPDGGACSQSEECAGDAYCDGGGSDSCGMCRPRVPLGGACDGAPCTRDVMADCSDGVCVEVRNGPAAAAGQPCGRIDAGASGVTVTRCAAGLWCSNSSSGSCREPIAEGQACASSNDVCVQGALCIEAGGTRTCQRVTLATQAGASCDPHAFEACDPVARLVCQDGACVLLGDGNAGSSCRDADFEIGCNPGLVCVDGTCQAPLRDGSTCVADEDCESGRCTMDSCAPVLVCE